MAAVLAGTVPLLAGVKRLVLGGQSPTDQPEVRGLCGVCDVPVTYWRDEPSEGLDAPVAGQTSGSQVGSHPAWIAVDGGGPGWSRRPATPGRMDSCGCLRTPLGDLRIRRLGVRVTPGALGKPLVDGGLLPVSGGRRLTELPDRLLGGMSVPLHRGHPPTLVDQTPTKGGPLFGAHVTKVRAESSGRRTRKIDQQEGGKSAYHRKDRRALGLA